MSKTKKALSDIEGPKEQEGPNDEESDESSMESSSEEESDDDGLPLVIGPDNRVAVPGDAKLNYAFRCFPNFLTRETGFMERLKSDCATAFTSRNANGEDYSAGETFWIQADAKPRCLLEQLALEIFSMHTKGCAEGSFIPQHSGAEWWTLDLEGRMTSAFTGIKIILLKQKAFLFALMSAQ